MRGSQRPGELLERLVVLRASYRLRSSYDRSAVMSVESAVAYGELLMQRGRRPDNNPYIGWFRRAA